MEPWPDRLRRLRNHTGLSQAKVARVLGIAAASVAQWEIGRSKPEVDRLPMLAQLFGVSLDELTGHDLKLPPARISARARPADDVVGMAPAAPIVGRINRGRVTMRIDARDGSNDSGVVAVAVADSSMFPDFFDGDQLIIARNHVYSRDRFLYRDCIVRLERGQLVIARVLPGDVPGTYILLGPGAPPIVDARIDWASPVLIVNRISAWPDAIGDNAQVSLRRAS